MALQQDEMRPGEITEVLRQVTDGKEDAQARLMPLVYAELRRVAAAYMRRERPGHTLQATALVHEAYIKLVGQHEVHWQNRAHFFGVAAQVMRRILVDHARAQRAGKRGGPRNQVTLDDAMLVEQHGPADLIELDEALNRLAAFDARQSRIVELRYFGGLSVEECACLLNVSPKTIKRDWSVARAWLYGELTKNRPDDHRALGTD